MRLQPVTCQQTVEDGASFSNSNELGTPTILLMERTKWKITLYWHLLVGQTDIYRWGRMQVVTQRLLLERKPGVSLECAVNLVTISTISIVWKILMHTDKNRQTPNRKIQTADQWSSCCKRKPLTTSATVWPEKQQYNLKFLVCIYKLKCLMHLIYNNEITINLMLLWNNTTLCNSGSASPLLLYYPGWTLLLCIVKVVMSYFSVEVTDGQQATFDCWFVFVRNVTMWKSLAVGWFSTLLHVKPCLPPPGSVSQTLQQKRTWTQTTTIYCTTGLMYLACTWYWFKKRRTVLQFLIVLLTGFIFRTDPAGTLVGPWGLPRAPGHHVGDPCCRTSEDSEESDLCMGAIMKAKKIPKKTTQLKESECSTIPCMAYNWMNTKLNHMFVHSARR